MRSVSNPAGDEFNFFSRSYFAIKRHIQTPSNLNLNTTVLRKQQASCVGRISTAQNHRRCSKTHNLCRDREITPAAHLVILNPFPGDYSPRKTQQRAFLMPFRSPPVATHDRYFSCVYPLSPRSVAYQLVGPARHGDQLHSRSIGSPLQDSPGTRRTHFSQVNGPYKPSCSWHRGGHTCGRGDRCLGTRGVEGVILRYFTSISCRDAVRVKSARGQNNQLGNKKHGERDRDSSFSRVAFIAALVLTTL